MNVFLDLDGTLVDSREGITRCIRYALKHLGVTSPPYPELEACIGPPLQAALAKLIGPACKDDGAKALRLYRLRYAEKGIYEQVVYPGANELLSGIRARSWRAYLVTSKPTPYVQRIVERFDLKACFAGIYGSELDGTFTDKSDLISRVLEEESIRPSETVMVGDRRHDIKGAHANGLPAIGVTYGFGSRKELQQAGADYLCDTPEAVLETLERRFGANG